MILVVLAALCVLTVPLTGGHLKRLATIEVRHLWLPFIAVGLQLWITTLAPNGDRTLYAAIHIATYALIAAFVISNRHLPGVAVIAAGALLNGAVIVINGGVMPAAQSAQRIAGMTIKAGFNNSAHLAHPHLLWLGDVIPVPGPLPNVLSVGDVVVFVGLVVLLHRVCRRPDVLAGLSPERVAQLLPGVQS